MIDTITRVLGLVSQYNPLATQPGTFAKADDCVNLRENVLEDRRGYKVDAILDDNIKQLLPFGGRVLAHNSDKINYGPGVYTSVTPDILEPTGEKIRAAEAASNLYFTTDEGVKCLADATGTAARPAGVPRALDPALSIASGGSGFLSDGKQVAYRVVIQKIDQNKNVLNGYPSSRVWITNASGNSKNIDVVFYLPTECVEGDIAQFYRTAQFTGTTDDVAGDEMGLVYQYSLTALDIASGFISFTDSVTDALRGATLYTSPSEQGILQANDRPPLCKDIALYRSQFLLFANTETRQRLFLNLVGAGSLTGKTITLAGVTYNFGASEIISGAGAPQVQVSATGVAAVDIDKTARSLVRVMNRYAGNSAVYAYYQSGPDDLPGQMLIEARTVGGASFTAQSSDSAISGMFYPAPPVVPGTNPQSTSSNSVQKNALFYSKSQEFEAVPALNYLLAGPSNEAILRIAPLRESCIIIKEKGVYRLTGDAPSNFTIVPLDLTVFCKAPDSVAVLSNSVIFLSNQGVVSVSETGVQVISRDIEPKLKPLLTAPHLKDVSVGFSYESDRHYFLSTITDISEDEQNQTFVYNIFTKTWVRWTFGVKAASVEPISDLLYFAKVDSPNVFVERKAFSNEDYADPELPINILSIVENEVTFEFAGTPNVGWAVKQDGTAIPIESLTTVGTGIYKAVMDSEPPGTWTPGAAELFPSVGFDIEWNPWTQNQPGLLKQVRGIKVLTDNTVANAVASVIFATFKSNFDEETEEVPLSSSGSSWGGPWGTISWGGGGDSYGYPTWVPKNKQYCTRLSVGVRHKAALEKTSICGVVFDFETSSDRIGR